MTNKLDASVAPKPGESADNGTTVRTVPEAEFLRTKESLSAALSASEKLTESLNTERAARQVVEAKVKGLEPQVAELTTLKPKYEALSAELQGVRTAALEQRRTALTEKYGVPAEKVKTLSADQIKTLEDTLPAVSRTVVTAKGLDGGSHGAPGPDLNLRPSERIAAALKNSKV